MSERLAAVETEESGEEVTEDTQGAWKTGEHYSRMKIDAGQLGNGFYYSIPAITVLAQTREDLDTLNSDFSALFSKYAESIVVGNSHETSLILSLNQAAADLAADHEIIQTLRAKIFELTGSYDDAGGWEEPNVQA